MKDLMLALALAFVPFANAVAQDGGAVATATALLDNMDQGDFQSATSGFNAQMSAAMSATQLAGVQAQLESAGAVTSRDEAKLSTRDGYTIVLIRIHRAQGAIDATVSIDVEGKVAGLFFAPANAGAQ